MLQLLHYLGIFSFFFLAKAVGERSYALSDAGYDPAADSVSVLPFTRAGNLILVKARVDTVEGNFILDTGAPHLILNITYFRDYPATLHEGEQTGITGTGGGILRTRVKSFNLGHMDYADIEADLTNLGHIENNKGVKILGLLGIQLFAQCEMVIDYEQNQIYLQKIPKKKKEGLQLASYQDSAPAAIIPFELRDNRIMLNTVMNGKKLKFVVDCAAETNVLDSRLPDKILEQVTITRRVVLTGSNNKKVDALYGDLSSLKIGGEQLDKLPVLITNLENTCFSYAGCVDGVLGFDFLSLHKVGFNFVTRKMYLWK